MGVTPYVVVGNGNAALIARAKARGDSGVMSEQWARRQGRVREELMEVVFRNSARMVRERAPRRKKTSD